MSEVGEAPALRGRGSPEIRAEHPAAAESADSEPGNPRAAPTRLRSECAGPGWAAGARRWGASRPRGSRAQRPPRGRSSWTPEPLGESGACPRQPRRARARARGVAGAPSGGRASQVVWGVRRPAGSGGRGELRLPGAVPARCRGMWL